MNKMTVKYPRPLKLERTDCYVAVATGNRFRAVDAITTRLTTGVPEPMINLQSVHDSEVGAVVPLTRFIREFVDEDTWNEMNKEPEPKKPEADVFVEKATGIEYVVKEPPIGADKDYIYLETFDRKIGTHHHLREFMTEFFPANIKPKDASLEQNTEGAEEPCFVPSAIVDAGVSAESTKPSKPSLYELCEYARTLQGFPFAGTNERLTNVYNTIEKRLGLKGE